MIVTFCVGWLWAIAGGTVLGGAKGALGVGLLYGSLSTLLLTLQELNGSRGRGR